MAAVLELEKGTGKTDADEADKEEGRTAMNEG